MGAHMAITITQIDPVAFSIFGLDVRWYALAYVVSFVVGYFLFVRLMHRSNSGLDIPNKKMDDLLTAIILGVVLGGRFGYVLFYNLGYFIAHPLEIFAVWHGGMSFHGGLIGAIAATFWFGWKNRINSWRILDLLAVVAPIGLFFGRIANFVNMELMGYPTSVPWAVEFVDKSGNVLIPASHPSPLYEAFGEGVVLFVLMYCLYRYTRLRQKPGALAGIMGMGYAVVRIVCEVFRVPDVQVGFLSGDWLTMGMTLSFVMFFCGFAIFMFAFRKK